MEREMDTMVLLSGEREMDTIVLLSEKSEKREMDRTVVLKRDMDSIVVLKVEWFFITSSKLLRRDFPGFWEI